MSNYELFAVNIGEVVAAERVKSLYSKNVVLILLDREVDQLAAYATPQR